MPDIFNRVLPLNLIANTVIFYVAARLYLLPLVSRLRPQQILLPILLLHSTRHLGMMFLTRGATYLSQMTSAGPATTRGQPCREQEDQGNRKQKPLPVPARDNPFVLS